MEQGNEAVQASDQINKYVDTNQKKWSNWLKSHASYSEKLDYVRPAICQFTLLWIMFVEAKRSFEEKKQKTVQGFGREEFYEELANNHLSCKKSFTDALEHLKERYSTDRGPDVSALYIGCKSDRDLVIKVLGNEELVSKEIVKAVFIVLIHYRNRLIHGHKLRDCELPNQLKNFTHANNVLMETIEILKQATNG